MTPEQIQSQMDAGKSLSEIARHFEVHHETINRIIKRHNLEWYEAFDEKIAAAPKLWFYDDQFKIFKSEYGYENKEDCMRDAIGEFIRQYDLDEITIELLKRNRHIETYSYEVFGSLLEMYRFYGIDKTAVEYAMSSRRNATAALGHEFQALVKEIYDEITLARSEQTRIEDCIPDFISGFTWLDAKLSKSTAKTATIQKYRKYTDWLIIIYAIDDRSKPIDGAIYKHVSEYYQYISDELQRKIDAFIRKATEVKFGENNRLPNV